MSSPSRVEEAKQINYRSKMNKFKSGFAVMAGLPNAGKSTLLNALAGGLLSAVTHKPQTTRQNILAISEDKNYQIIFVDTPGFLNPQYDLQRGMSRALDSALNEDGDIVLFIYDHTQTFKSHAPLISKLKKVLCPIILVVNKTDVIKDKEGLENAAAEIKKELKISDTFYISAIKNEGVAELKEKVVSLLPGSPAYFEKGQWTDRWERFYAEEFIREQIFLLYEKEVPYSTYVEIEKFTEDLGDKNYIRATVYVERDSQKGIIIGARGAAIAQLRQKSQARINEFLGRKYRIELNVEVKPNWRADRKFLKEKGFFD